MDFGHSEKVSELQAKLRIFMQDFVIRAEVISETYLESHRDHWGPAPVMADLKAEAKRQGLWNLFLPQSDRGAGLTNLEYAPLAELTGWSPHIGPEALNCSSPDSGNMELLAKFGTSEQQDNWLTPLLAGEIRSIFSMTEPDVASSDASNVRLRIERDGDEWVLNGRKSWSTGALRPDVKVSFLMGVTDPDGATGKRHSIVLVPMHTPGVRVTRSTKVLGFDDRHEGGHGIIDFTDVRVPLSSLLGAEGEGFAVAQARLGPGRIHHCMRLIGMGERSIALMTARAQSRVAFGQLLSDQGVIQNWIAEARTSLNAARLLVLNAAWTMDELGSKEARHDIGAAKIMVPQVVKQIVDHAIQVFGGAGVSQDTILSSLYAQARFLQIADGPDEVHKRSLARAEFKSTPALKVDW